jgi:hypothetical protein
MAKRVFCAFFLPPNTRTRKSATAQAMASPML